MSQPEPPDADSRIDQVRLPPLSFRDKLIAALIILGLVACVGFSVLKELWRFDFQSAVLCLLGFLGLVAVVVIVQYYRQGFFTWMRLARQPAQAMQRGNPEAAERAYQSALARAKRFGPLDRRRGLMLADLAGYLVLQGRRQEARALAEESLRILAQHPREDRDHYFLAIQNLSLFLIAAKEYEAAQRLLDRGMDAILILKKPADANSGGPGAWARSSELVALDSWNFVFQTVLAYLLIEADELSQAEHRLGEIDRIFSEFNARWQTAYHDSCFLIRAHWHCAVGQFEEAERWCAQTQLGPADSFFARVRAAIDLARKDYLGAEHILRDHLDMQGRVGTRHRQDLLPHTLALADALFGQAKHDDAFASFEEARSIVADFALPADNAWRKALATWLQRAKDLGRTELAASLEKELAQVSATPIQAITILEKFRIQPPAGNDG
jgi:tetratricopeptide (TPR) repeat protein